ncbi:c-type cytochrome [Roseateles saccharophilus]|nr:c-type cytochrome [Roseateles saccharophilus]
MLVALGMPAHAQKGAPGFPSWAYVMGPGAVAPKVPDDGTRFSVPGSTARFTRDQTRDRFAPPDWHPDDHPAMPAIVAGGRPPAVWACGFCHRPNGAGGPENARIAGLPAEYIAQQLRDLVSGARSTVLPTRNAAHLKRAIVKALTDEDIQVAAAYFSRLAPRQTLIVKESERAPKTVNLLNIMAAGDDGEWVKLDDDRIVEVPENLERFDVLRDDQVKFLVYAPLGSIAKGRALARAPGGNAALACAGCHGADLRGAGRVPSIAGRSPSYVVRQLWDIRAGARNGQGAQAMKPIVTALSSQDMLELAAYLATLDP